MARILIVEDEPDIALGLEMELREEGYEVEVVGDGVEAVQRGKQPGWDLILLDGRTPQEQAIACRQAVTETVSTSAGTCAGRRSRLRFSC